MSALVATKRGLLGALAVVLTDDSKAMYAELSVAHDARRSSSCCSAPARSARCAPDITAEDLLQTVYALCYARQPEPGWEAQVLRLLDIFIDGLRVS